MVAAVSSAFSSLISLLGFCCRALSVPVRLKIWKDNGSIADSLYDDERVLDFDAVVERRRAALALPRRSLVLSSAPSGRSKESLRLTA